MGDLFSHIAESGGFLFEDEANTIVWCLLTAIAALHERVSRISRMEMPAYGKSSGIAIAFVWHATMTDVWRENPKMVVRVDAALQ